MEGLLCRCITNWNKEATHFQKSLKLNAFQIGPTWIMANYCCKTSREWCWCRFSLCSCLFHYFVYGLPQLIIASCEAWGQQCWNWSLAVLELKGRHRLAGLCCLLDTWVTILTQAWLPASGCLECFLQGLPLPIIWTSAGTFLNVDLFLQKDFTCTCLIIVGWEATKQRETHVGLSRWN